MSHFIFSSPRKYVQGRGVLDELGEQLKPLGTKAFLMADGIVWDIIGQRVDASLKQASIGHHYERFNGEASSNEITRLAKLARDAGTNIVVGLGGGKTLDTAKAVADELKHNVAIVPTVASTDAPCSALSVIYTDEGVFESYRFYDKNPDLVLVDTAVCAQAPARLFASGIADGLATFVEAQAVLRSHALSMLGGKPTLAGMAIAETCEKTLLTYGYSAYKAVEKGAVTPAVESVVEANTLLSGLGFENGGLAGAHAIHNGFTAIKGDIHHLTHGEKVAYGTLTHMVLEQRPDEEIARYIRFYRAINMPTLLKDLHLENESFENLVKVGELACSDADTLKNLDSSLTAEDVAHAIVAVDAFSKTIS
ncbi:iron-containing alcohol dehydrogenase [Pectobacterium versatile]|uniref:glycerol dehydrogenase n=1 Tax=Pectobacterium TaxID=122277 RepID=UPI00057F6A04|nr:MULTISPECIES: glycerol dehydrogenase [Pectobacterium]KHT36200.1 glycerol dehydrogenase [Pectobacterium carotovorum subsp. carotovorum]MBA0180674.1 glycerol dehydrogenase [Pectobacterium carotovorum]MBA0193674.1 glycerol dehydrogenase [Pectobacterium carotovorum]MBB1526105.1 glycerol dehydrogenase [Pectobacterium carotovorum subsp. carotovorum]MBN3193306.1 glycerol dehydrogenase [Pectobacterium versatile]